VKKVQQEKTLVNDLDIVWIQHIIYMTS